MLTLERKRKRVANERPVETPDMGQVREDVDRLHRAGIGAINRALSGNSQTFLNAVKQQQGE